MLVLPLEDFKEEIKAEMYGYEEIEETLIERWFAQFDTYIKAKKKNELINYASKGIEIKLKDESDLFMIVDKFLAAVVNEDLEAYFNNWTL